MKRQTNNYIYLPECFKNDDGTYNQSNEPTIIKKYNLETGVLIDIIDKEIRLELQKTLEGSMK